MNQKITLSLTKSELKKLKQVAKGNEFKNLNNLITLLTDKKDTDEYIKDRVFQALSDLSGFGIDYINENQKLKIDLGLTNYHKKSLKTYFQRIVKDLKSNKTITISECEKLKKVSGCLKLIKSKL